MATLPAEAKHGLRNWVGTVCCMVEKYGGTMQSQNPSILQGAQKYVSWAWNHDIALWIRRKWSRLRSHNCTEYRNLARIIPCSLSIILSGGTNANKLASNSRIFRLEHHTHFYLLQPSNHYRPADIGWYCPRAANHWEAQVTPISFFGSRRRRSDKKDILPLPCTVPFVRSVEKKKGPTVMSAKMAMDSTL
jgi:hypothetical protein